MKNQIIRWVVGGLVVGFLGGCSGSSVKTEGPPPPPPNPSVSKAMTLAPFASCDEAVHSIRTALTEQMEKSYKNLEGQCQFDSSMPNPLASPSSTGSNSGNVTFTDTNVQETGVDEADLVKTDGKFLYVLNQTEKELHIIRTTPFSQFGEISKTLIDGAPESLYLIGNKVLVFSSILPPVEASGVRGMTVAPVSSMNGYNSYCAPSTKTQATIFNVADTSRPTKERTSLYDGCLVSSGRIENQVYMVLNATGKMPQLNYYTQIDYASLPKCSDKSKKPPQALLDGIKKLR